MARLSTVLFVTAAAVAFTPVSVWAQSQHPFSVEGTLGGGFGRGGPEPRNRGGFAVDALLGLRLGRALNGRGTAGLSAGWQGALAGADDCPTVPSRGCLGDYPRFFSTAVLAGVEIGRAHGATTRLLVGPAYFLEEEGEKAFGMQARIDVSTPAVLHLSLVASGRASVLPNFRGDVYSLGSLGAGVRIR